MGTELKPIPGQPGLYRMTEDEGLGATRYGGTQTFVRTRRAALNGLETLSTLDATRYGGTQTFQRTTRRTALGDLSAALPEISVVAKVPIKFGQEEIKPGAVAGIAFELFIFVTQQAISQAALDDLYRPAFAQLGYDVSSSTLSTDALTWGWKKDGDSWEAVVTQGPDKVLGQDGFKIVYQAPVAADMAGLPKVVEHYTLTIRPRDGVLTQPKIDALRAATTSAQVALLKNVLGAGAVQFITTKGVAGVFNIGLWLGLIGAGTLSMWALAGKDKPPKKARAPRKPGMFKNPFKGRRW
jgi:hypothetical protein